MKVETWQKRPHFTTGPSSCNSELLWTDKKFVYLFFNKRNISYKIHATLVMNSEISMRKHFYITNLKYVSNCKYVQEVHILEWEKIQFCSKDTRLEINFGFQSFEMRSNITTNYESFIFNLLNHHNELAPCMVISWSAFIYFQDNFKIIWLSSPALPHC